MVWKSFQINLAQVSGFFYNFPISRRFRKLPQSSAMSWENFFKIPILYIFLFHFSQISKIRQIVLQEKNI